MHEINVQSLKSIENPLICKKYNFIALHSNYLVNRLNIYRGKCNSLAKHIHSYKIIIPAVAHCIVHYVIY